MKIQSSFQYPSYNWQAETYNSVRFGSASDISLEYVYKRHAKYIPTRMINKIKELLGSKQKELPKLYELHNEVYKGLFDANSLEEAKILYPELGEVEDLTSYISSRSKAIKAIKKIMPVEKFSLFLLKKLYAPTAQDTLVKELGFTNRSLLGWLSDKLRIKKLDGNYIQLLKMSNEKENSRIAELSRRAIYSNPEAQQKRLSKAAETHRTIQYRAKKKQEMKDFYARNPEVAQRTGIISKRTWDRCPEIKDALSKYTRSLNPYVKKVLSKKLSGAILNAEERRVAYGYYRGFWEQNANLRRIYRERRLQVIEELKNS